ncbi:MAG: transposase [candidate division Zixibacteria bacterium]|nr:transposase [candidate division Zixibacteria bacterium]
MQLPIVAPAPLVTAHAGAFRDLFENRCQFRHFQNYLTGLMVLSNKSMSNMVRCVLDSADKTNLSRFFTESPWFQDQVNDRRLGYLLQQTKSARLPKDKSALVLDDTLCEHVGSLFEYIDRHYNHGDDTYPLAHNPVTSHYVSGPVRFPVDLRLYRRYEEMTRWEEFVRKHFPDREIPKRKKERTQFHKVVDPVLLQDPDFQTLDQQFRTKIALAIELLEAALRRKLPFGVVLFDSWYLAEEFVAVLQRRKKDWISILKKNRNLETNSFVLKDADGKRIPLDGPHISVEDLVPLIPATAYRAVTVGETTYWTFTLAVRIPSLGKVRLVISFEKADLTGTYAVLVTNRVDWTALRVIATYLLRWPIETFYQDGKGHLGLDEYRMRDAEAIQKHWCLVFVAYSLLHLDCLPPSPTKSRLPIKTIGEACRQQAQALIETLILQTHERLQQGQQAHEVLALLFAKQQVIAAI